VRTPARWLVAAGLTFSALGLAGCGGRFVTPHGDAARTTVIGGGQVVEGDREDSTTSSSSPLAGSNSPARLSSPSTEARTATTPTTNHAANPSVGNSMQVAVTSDYEDYLVDLSGLDDTLNKAYVARVAAVATNRLAQATVRQAAALQAAQEHGVGTLRDDHVSIVMTGPASAVLADCQDEDHFSVVKDSSGTPDPFVQRGTFVGSAQMVLQDGRWLVDVFTTTHDSCTF
jgi:hypothetical protein